MRWSDFEDYLTFEHLGGKAFVLEVREVAVEEFYDKSLGITEKKPVLYFKGTDKGLILSATNRKALKALFGDEMNACVGQKLSLRAERVVAFGKAHWPIRIFQVSAPNGKPHRSEQLVAWAREHNIPEDAVTRALQATAHGAACDTHYNDARRLLEREYVLKAA